MPRHSGRAGAVRNLWEHAIANLDLRIYQPQQEGH
nr:hypothetical protein [Mesorhizobium sp.]